MFEARRSRRSWAGGSEGEGTGGAKSAVEKLADKVPGEDQRSQKTIWFGLIFPL